MNTPDTRILRISLLADRARTGIYASAAVAFSQILMRAQVSPDEGASEAEQLGASMASGIIDALTAPLLYGSLALMVLFIVLAVTYHTKLGTLMREHDRQQPTRASVPTQPPYIPPVTWGRTPNN